MVHPPPATDHRRRSDERARARCDTVAKTVGERLVPSAHMTVMDLALTKSASSRSLERRWMLDDAPLVEATLPPARIFVPTDLRVWHRLDDTSEEGWTVRAWPADREDRAFAVWRSTGLVTDPLPDWIEERAARARADLAANRAGADPEATERWTHSIDTDWTVEGAEPVLDQNRAFSFIPGRLSVACWTTPDGSEDESRYRIDLIPADHRTRGRQLWTGTEAHITRGGLRMADMPEWIAAILTDQYDRLGEEAGAAAEARAA